MPPTPQEIADKFAREWIESKATAITNYSAIAGELATRAIAAKQKMIDNFATAMATTKYEDRLAIYEGNTLMQDAYTQALDAKIAITDAEKLKIQNDVALKRALRDKMPAVLQVFKNANAQGQVTVPPNITDQGLLAMLVQGINSHQFEFSLATDVNTIYTDIAPYMNTALGWPINA